MATSVVFPRAQFFANNGKPLIGGRIHTYAAGSSTRSRTYRDAAKTQPNTNPILLDARGEAAIYLAEGVEYKFVLEDALGAQILTQEPVYGAVWPNAAEWPSDTTLSYQYMTEAKAVADANSPVKFFDTYAQAVAGISAIPQDGLVEISQDETKSGARTRYRKDAGALDFVVNLDQVRLDLASPAHGAALVEFKQEGAGAVARTVKDKEMDVVSVLDFATKSQREDVRALTYSVDTHSALTAAKTAINASGGALFFPFGRYLLNAALAIAASSVALLSNGATIVNGQQNGSAIYFGDGINRYYGNSVNGLNFTSKSGDGVFGQVGITFKMQGHLKVTNIVADNNIAPLYRGISFDDVNQYNVSGIEVQRCIETGIIYLNCTDGRIVNGRSDANGGPGHWLNGSQGHNFSNVSAYDNRSVGWRLVSQVPTTGSNKNNWFVSCVGDTSGGHNWEITDSKDTYFVACWGATQRSIAANTWATGFYIGSANVKGLQFIGGCALNNNSHGVLIDSTGGGPENIQMSNFQFGNTGAAFSGNGQSGAGYGLAINGTANLIRVNGGSFLGNASGSFNNTSTGDDIAVVGRPIGYKNEARGVSGVIADNGVIAHGLASTPAYFTVHASMPAEIATASVADATNITVSIKTGSGATGTPQKIYWEAYV